MVKSMWTTDHHDQMYLLNISFQKHVNKEMVIMVNKLPALIYSWAPFF